MENIFNRLWDIYSTQNPAVKKVYDLFREHGEEVVNDHIAFRTFDDPRISVDVLARPFMANGYTEKGSYVFEEKKLTAKHYEIDDNPRAPRVFISQLLTDNFSGNLQKIVKESVDRISPEKLRSDDLIYSGNLWGPSSYEIYNQLKKESEYAAWLYVFGFCANHFTVSVNYLNKLNTLEKANQFLKDNGFKMNDSGGEIKGTPQQLLEQSSIKSGIVTTEFSDGSYDVPGCYYEFARRYPDASGNLFSGFIAKSADKIFESTNFYQGE